MNPLAVELNRIIAANNAVAPSMFSELGRQLFFPKGILSQSAEAKEKAHHINATIGIARESGGYHVLGQHYGAIVRYECC